MLEALIIADMAAESTPPDTSIPPAVEPSPIYSLSVSVV